MQPMNGGALAARTRRVYDRLAAVYPVSTFLFHSKAHRAALAASGIENGMRVLEVATGSGEMFRRLVEANPRGSTWGVDLSPNMAARTLRQARKEFPSAHTACQAVDARHLPFRDGSFDAIFCCYLLELLGGDGVARALAEFRRVLRPYGTLNMVLIGQCQPGFNRIYKALGSLVPAFWGRQVSSWAADLVEAHQFHIESDRTVHQTLYPSRVLTARLMNGSGRAG